MVRVELTEAAYAALHALKLPGESDSAALLRVCRHCTDLGMSGPMSEDQAAEWRRILGEEWDRVLQGRWKQVTAEPGSP